MPVIPYDAYEFPNTMPASLRGNHDLTVDWADIIWAAVSVGKMGLEDLLSFGLYSLDEIRYRIFFVRANLYETEDRLQRTPAYDNLDPTEKGAISYFLGMALGRLICYRLLSTPWLVHLSKLVNVQFLPGRSRPDLAGLDRNGRWIVCEAKGRTGGYSHYAHTLAKAQVRQVRQINGTPPYLGVATEAYFADCLRMSLIDPEESRPEAINLSVDRATLMRRYYSPFLTVLEHRNRTEKHFGQNYAVIDYESLGVRLSVSESVHKIAEMGEPLQLEEEKINAERIKTVQDGWSYSYYGDGLAVAVDRRWSIDVMKVPPDRR